MFALVLLSVAGWTIALLAFGVTRWLGNSLMVMSIQVGLALLTAEFGCPVSSLVTFCSRSNTCDRTSKRERRIFQAIGQEYKSTGLTRK